jgi:hypothetical protein
MGDGTNIGKNKKMLNFGFTLLNDTKTKPCSEAGFFSLGLFEIEKECSHSLENSLKSILDDLNNTKIVKYNEIEYDLKFYLGGDLKFLATMMGTGQANSNYPCPWCFYQKDELKNYNGSISEYIRYKNHTIHDRTNKANLKDKQNKIIKFVEYDDVYADDLHMVIRITERIIECIIINFKQYDYKDSNQSLNLRSNNINEFPSVTIFNNILSESGIKIVYNEKKKKLTPSQLNSDQIWKLYAKLKKNELLTKLSNVTNVKYINIVLLNFLTIISNIKDNKYSHEYTKVTIDNWFELFLTLFGFNSITPYIHIFTSHTHEFIKNSKCFNFFNAQGLEKNNDTTSRLYFKGSNKKKTTNSSYTVQMLQKKNRMEYLREIRRSNKKKKREQKFKRAL